MSDYCPNETSLVDIGGGKSFCTRLNKWTNCREVRHCTADDLKPEQLTLFEGNEENER